MLRQLARLTIPVESAGEGACAIAVYADAAHRIFPAAERGFEGVACVDDAARALILLSDVWSATGVSRVRDWALGLLDFLLYMQLDDGRFVNFVTDWSGRRNQAGVTSFPGGGFWHARGVRALARAAVTFGEDRARLGLERGLVHIRAARDVPADVRSIHVLTAIELVRAGKFAELRADIGSWCDEIAACRRGGVLFDNPDQSAPHLWGHQQEGVLAEAGAFLGRDDLTSVARQSALAYLAPLIEAGFDEPTVQPYGVASAVYSTERLRTITNEPRFDELWRMARGWFDGRNSARSAVYDREEGRVYDGVDHGVLNVHSGAESNVVGAQALLDQVIRTVPLLAPLIETCFAPDVRERLGTMAEARSS
ncbi:MAG: hypothetical protein E6I19_09120 [Chloroflexi bacterium]|nr:MAG: hypothetical protein E6I48_07370 [Chloroflexota bacterium]TMF54990.1 MAG: hypothetical protein E6I19_09120 [Chloroflexota bacterium]